jgi:hypothetical protein
MREGDAVQPVGGNRDRLGHGRAVLKDHHLHALGRGVGVGPFSAGRGVFQSDMRRERGGRPVAGHRVAPVVDDRSFEAGVEEQIRCGVGLAECHQCRAARDGELGVGEERAGGQQGAGLDRQRPGAAGQRQRARAGLGQSADGHQLGGHAVGGGRADGDRAFDLEAARAEQGVAVAGEGQVGG